MPVRPATFISGRDDRYVILPLGRLPRCPVILVYHKLTLAEFFLCSNRPQKMTPRWCPQTILCDVLIIVLNHLVVLLENTLATPISLITHTIPPEPVPLWFMNLCEYRITSQTAELHNLLVISERRQKSFISLNYYFTIHTYPINRNYVLRGRLENFALHLINDYSLMLYIPF